MDRDIIEAEFLACVGLCVNDFFYGRKSVLVRNCENKKILELLSRLNCDINDTKCDKFDLIIDLQNDTTKQMLAMTKKDTIIIVNLPNLETSVESALDSIQNAPFGIKMPFKILDNYYLFLSDKFHPLADVSLQKIDMIESLQYYNAKIHEAAFAMPNYLKVALKDVVRN